jgi:hypothetical protein
MFRFEGTIRHCLLWRARSHRHDDLRDTTAETYRARALFPRLLVDHAERVVSVTHESRHLPQPRTPVIMGPGRSLSLQRDRLHRPHQLPACAPRLCESCLAIPFIIQDYRPLDEARGFLVPSMLLAPFRPRTSHVMGFGSVLPDRTSPKRVQEIQNGRAQSRPHRVERKTARRMQTHQSLLSLRQWLSARPRS